MDVINSPAFVVIATMVFIASLAVILVKCACCGEKSNRSFPAKIMTTNTVEPYVIEDETQKKESQVPAPKTKTTLEDNRPRKKRPAAKEDKKATVVQEKTTTRPLSSVRSKRSEKGVTGNKSSKEAVEDSVVHGRESVRERILAKFKNREESIRKPATFNNSQCDWTPKLEPAPVDAMASLAPPSLGLLSMKTSSKKGPQSPLGYLDVVQEPSLKSLRNRSKATIPIPVQIQTKQPARTRTTAPEVKSRSVSVAPYSTLSGSTTRSVDRSMIDAKTRATPKKTNR